MKKQISYKLEYLRKLTGLNLFADYAACYGGYRLDLVGEGGTRYGAFGMSSIEPRMKAKEFLTLLNGLIAGIEYGRKNA